MSSMITVLSCGVLVVSVAQIAHAQWGNFGFAGGMDIAGLMGMAGLGGGAGGRMNSEWLMDDPFKADRMPVWNQLMMSSRQGRRTGQNNFGATSGMTSFGGNTFGAPNPGPSYNVQPQPPSTGGRKSSLPRNSNSLNNALLFSLLFGGGTGSGKRLFDF